MMDYKMQVRNLLNSKNKNLKEKKEETRGDKLSNQIEILLNKKSVIEEMLKTPNVLIMKNFLKSLVKKNLEQIEISEDKAKIYLLEFQNEEINEILDSSETNILEIKNFLKKLLQKTNEKLVKLKEYLV